MFPKPAGRADSFAVEVPTLRLKANSAARVLRGHPWVFGNEVDIWPAEAADGEVVECRDARGRFLGSGVFNRQSQIVWRRFNRTRVALDASYLREALTRAFERRDREGKNGDRKPENRDRKAETGDGLPIAREAQTAGEIPEMESVVRRLVWSESDELPGLVIDQFGSVLVVQTQTLALERRLETVLGLLMELRHPTEIIIRNDAPIRRLEGLPLEVRTASGRPWEPRWLTIGGLDYWLDLMHGQKTGFYLDQLQQHPLVARWAAGRRVLDCFCNQGSFALHAGRAGASRVLGLDSSEDAIALARKNAERNAVTAEFTVGNVFDYLAGRSDENWDLIVLDPPPFARSKSALAGALRGYKEINLRAMQRLTPGGILATYSCSHHVTAEIFRDLIADAAHDTKRLVQVLEFCHQPSDHPVLVTMPESEYLRGYILRVE